MRRLTIFCAIVLSLLATFHAGSPSQARIPFEQGGECAIFCERRGLATAVAWHPDGEIIAVGGNKGIWLYTSDFEDVAYLEEQKGITSLSWSPDGSKLAAATVHDSVSIYDLESLDVDTIYDGHSSIVMSVAWSPNGNLIASGEWVKSLQIWSPHTAEVYDETNDWEIQLAPTIEKVAWSPDGTQLSILVSAHHIFIWNVADHAVELEINPGGILYAVEWSPYGNALAFARDAGVPTIDIWDSQSGTPLSQFQGHTAHIVPALAWSPDARRIAVLGSDDQTVWVWDVDTGEVIAALETGFSYYLDAGPAGFADSLAWSPDGNYLVAVGYVDFIYMWDMNTYELIETFDGHDQRRMD